MSSLPDPITPSSVPAPTGPDRSLGELMGDVTRDLSTLLRQEVELAKAEMRQSASQAGKGAGMLGGAGVAGFLALLFVSIAAWWGLGYLIGNAWSAVVVAAIWAVVATALLVTGRGELNRVRGLPQTADTVSKIPNALKGKEEENR
jgi:hypothetical protein